MKFSQIKEIKTLTGDWREALEKIRDGETDFTEDDYRFIHKDSIDEILSSEIAADEYVLGSWTANAIATATGWPVGLVKAAQKGEAYAELGKAVISTPGAVEKMAELLIEWDGYGHHFASYDGATNEIGDWFVFRTN